jgi:hypothetical protein
MVAADGEVLAGQHGSPVGVIVAAGTPQLLPGLALSAGNLFTDTPIPFPLSLVPAPVVGPLAAKVLFSKVSLRAVLRLGITTPGVRLDARRYLGDRQQQRATATIFRHALTAPQYGCANVEAALPSLAMPTEIIWGEQDLSLDLDTPRRAQALIPDAQLHVVPGAGHFLPAERPNAFVDTIDKLRQRRDSIRDAPTQVEKPKSRQGRSRSGSDSGGRRPRVFGIPHSPQISAPFRTAPVAAPSVTITPPWCCPMGHSMTVGTFGRSFMHHVGDHHGLRVRMSTARLG